MDFPQMMTLRQRFSAPVEADVAGAVRRELGELDLASRVNPGQSVAVTVGSRGIANLALIIKTVVEVLVGLGARPFLVPAMGSHGGGTLEGQRTLVEEMGVTEEYTGAPIRATMEVVQMGTSPEGVPVHFDRFAAEADHVMIVNRVKPHTSLYGEVESGLHKMMLIGLGKAEGARNYHQAFVKYSFERIARSVGQEVIGRCRVLCGLAILENPNEQTALISAVAPPDFFSSETRLLQKARGWLPRLPFKEADLLIVDLMGKDISGSGMDTNVTGRKQQVHQAGPDEWPKITRIFVRDLTPVSHGNATGIGRCEFTHSRLVEKIDYQATFLNCLTANRPEIAAVPIHFSSDRLVLEAALGTIGLVPPAEAALMRIKSTMDVERVQVSGAYAPQVAQRDDLEIETPLADMAFDQKGDLLPF